MVRHRHLDFLDKTTQDRIFDIESCVENSSILTDIMPHTIPYPCLFDLSGEYARTVGLSELFSMIGCEKDLADFLSKMSFVRTLHIVCDIHMTSSIERDYCVMRLEQFGAYFTSAGLACMVAFCYD